MRDHTAPGRGSKKAAKPLNSVRFEEMALSYVARFSTTSAKFERYLVRKLRERGWEDEGEPPVRSTVERFVELGYIDDEAYARMKSSSLLRRGYGARRVRQALGQAGIAAPLRERVAPGERAAREAALAFVRRRRFGPFGTEPPEADKREKQIAAMVRAGHGFDAARTLIDAPSEIEIAEWLAEAVDEEEI